MVCAGIFVGIQILGHLLFGKDAMGDGDVKLARALGALLPLKLALVSFFLAIAIGAVVGGGVHAWQRLRSKEDTPGGDPAEGDADDEEMQPTPLSEVFTMGGVYLLFLDVVLWMGASLRIPRARDLETKLYGEHVPLEEDTWTPGPTHIPFGPYMVLGALLALFVGDRIVAGYLKWAGLA
jgi:leader peptidase (prepilin peptidase) / N-methyltransferase